MANVHFQKFLGVRCFFATKSTFSFWKRCPCRFIPIREWFYHTITLAEKLVTGDIEKKHKKKCQHRTKTTNAVKKAVRAVSEDDISWQIMNFDEIFLFGTNKILKTNILAIDCSRIYLCSSVFSSCRRHGGRRNFVFLWFLCGLPFLVNHFFRCLSVVGMSYSAISDFDNYF